MNRFNLKNCVLSILSATPQMSLIELGLLVEKRSGKNEYQHSTLKDYRRKFLKGTI